MDAPSLQRARTTPQETKESDSLEAQVLGGGEFRARRGPAGWNLAGGIIIRTHDLHDAMRRPVFLWPTNNAPFGGGAPEPHLEQ